MKPQFTVLCVIFLIIIQTSTEDVSGVQTSSNTTYGSANINSGYATLTWTINNDTVIFSLSCTAKAWIGIGFGDGMENVDMAVIEINNNNMATITDFWSQNQVRPKVDKQQDYTLLSQSVTNNSIAITFSRKLNTGDANQDTVLTVGTSYTWDFAYGDTNQMLLHTYMGRYNVNFGKVGVATSSTQVMNAMDSKILLMWVSGIMILELLIL